MNTHPAHFFIKWLLVLGFPPLEEVNQNLMAYGLAPITQEIYDRIESEIGALPDYLNLGDGKDKKTRTWLRKQGICSFVFPDEAVQETRDRIIFDPWLRSMVDTLLIGGVSPAEASYRLGKKGKIVSPLAIAEYQHYFWNSDRIGLEGWVSYLNADIQGRTGPRHEDLQAALRAGKEVALYKIGILKEIDSHKVLTEVQQELYHMFLEARTLPLSVDKVKMIGSLSRSICTIDERLKSSSSALQTVLTKFERFKVTGSTKKIPSLIELAPGGSVSDRSKLEMTSEGEGK